MTKTSQPAAQTRRHEHELTIDASPEAVWKAITEASQLTNWFPLDAEVTPGPNGSITCGWGEALRGTLAIEVWVPNRHLRTSWMSPDTGVDDSGLAVDWHLDRVEGGTRLRLVHSGFGLGEEWDKEYDGTRRGWAYELRSLKHYLERHAGQRRTCFWLTRPFNATPEEAWRRMIGPRGLLQSDALRSADVGDPVRVSLQGGDTIEGSVLLIIPPTDIALIADNWNRGLFRVSYEDCGEGLVLSVMTSFWGYPDAEAAAVKDRMEAALDALTAR